MNNVIKEKLENYYKITKDALEEAKKSPENIDINDNTRNNFIDAVERYVSDAEHFEKKGDVISAFAALNYAHGILDAGVLFGLFDVENEKLFAFVKTKAS